MEALKKIIDEEVNPQLKLHAASCELVSFEKGIVTIKIFGGCSGCPSSQLALFNSVVPILKEQDPAIRDVILTN